MRKLLLGVAATLSFGSAANAATIVNGSFEDGTDPGSFLTLPNGSPGIVGWSIGGASIDYIGSYWMANQGVRSIDLAGNGIGSVSQVIATVVNQAYNVSFWVSRNPDGAAQGAITPRTGFVDVGAGQSAVSYGNVLSNTGNMAWEQRNFVFNATSTLTTLRFSADSATSGAPPAFGMALDNVMIAAIPEPGTWMLMLLGFGAIGFAMRSRAKTQVRFQFA